MKSMVLLIAIILFAGCANNDELHAQDCSVDEEKLKDRYFLTSEDLCDEPGLYTLKILEGPEVQAAIIAWQDLLDASERTMKDMRDYKYYVYHLEEFFIVEIRTRELRPAVSRDGIYIYKIDANDFSVISREYS